MIPVSQPQITDYDVELVSDAMRTGWVSSTGPYIEQFEREFAAFCGVAHCVATANGTVAIHLALEALRIGPGDEVIVPDLTFVATANAVRQAGATPVAVDVRQSDWCIDPAGIERALTPATRAIMPVHLYGHPCAMDDIHALAEQHKLRIIEDAAEAHGAVFRGRRVGSFGDLATFSFYGNKIITTGEGGVITTDSPELAARARFLRDHAMSADRRYWHPEPGFNYRLTNLQAALGVAQLSRIDLLLSKRSAILEQYRSLLARDEFIMNPALPGAKPVNWMTSLVIPGFTREQRDELIQVLRTHGVDSRPFFYPLSQLPMYECDGKPVANELSATGLNLPTFPDLSPSDVEDVCRAVNAAFDQVAARPASRARN